MINLFDSNPVNGHSFMNDLKKEFDKRKMKQTAVDWLINQIELEAKLAFLDNRLPQWLIEKAKQMEKEQIIEAWMSIDNPLQRMSAEQYYKENYGK